MTNRVRPWVKDLLVFAGLTLLDAVLMGIGYQSLRSNFPAIPLWLNCWCWAVAAPLWAAILFNCPSESMVWCLFWTNPFIYGAMWWLAWKMFRLTRAKPTGDGSPPLHNE